jgi:putative transposase
MIRTVYFRCTLPRRVADALNRESGWIYTRVLVEHYRIYRKQGIWLKRGQAEKLDDAYHAGAGRLLHAHSIDAAQQGFYAACQTARTNKGNGRDGTKYPHKRKGHRTTVWKQTGLRLKDRRTSAERKASRGQPLIADSQSVLLLALAQGQAPLEVPLPSHLAGLGEAAFREMRLVYNKATRRYEWHLVIEDGQVAEPVDGKHVVAGDLGEIHPITLADDAQAQVIACRELRATRQYTNKTLAEIAHLQSQCTRHSRRWWRLERRKRRFLEKQARRVRDMEHKASRAAVDFAQERGAAVIAIGDVRDIADGKRLNSYSQQKISQWSHGTLRNFITYKANTVGITVVSTVSEVDTTKTCPNPACNHRHKPTGRI